MHCAATRAHGVVRGLAGSCGVVRGRADREGSCGRGRSHAGSAWSQTGSGGVVPSFLRCACG
eukprot:5223755-Prymnesium_polylepis.1